METPTSLTNSGNKNVKCNCKGQKRSSEEDVLAEGGNDDNKHINEHTQGKRYKPCLPDLNDDTVTESPFRLCSYLRPQEAPLEECKTFLSPIAEISKNLCETSINNTETDNNNLIEKCKGNGFTKLDLNKDDSNAILPEENYLNNNCHENNDFQMSRLGRDNNSNRRLNMTTSLHEMVVEDLSFYDDDNTIITSDDFITNSPPSANGILLPEGSPQRFQIVKKSKIVQTHTSSRPLLDKSVHNVPQGICSGGINALNNKIPTKGFRILQSLSSGYSTESSLDDEYMELFELEALEQEPNALNFPSDLNLLINGNIIKKSPVKTPEMLRRPSVRRCLTMTENVQQQQVKPKILDSIIEYGTNKIVIPATNNVTPLSTRSNCCVKRPDPPESTSCSPIQTKRQRSNEKENLDGSFTEAMVVNAKQQELPPTPLVLSTYKSSPVLSLVRPPLRKCMSMNDAEIMSALARSESSDEPDLIGDFSKPYILPLVDGRHRDLKSICSSTVAGLLNGEFDNHVASYKIIDCRYPYEYEGGHIRGAKNLYTQEQVIEEFLTQCKTEQEQVKRSDSNNKRNIIIFHCEFSSERGPKLSRFLRNYDRARNTNSYPALDYPEIYLLHNGYKEFFEQYAELCQPHAYRPMLEPSYNEEYRHFRAKSKSWNGDGLGSATATQRFKKSRSRLML